MTRAADLAKLIAGSSTLGGTGELVLKDVDTADGSSPKITFQTGDTDIAQDDVLGTIDFQAPDEGTGTDAILVSAGVEAKAEGDFSSSSNATSLTFKTGSSEAAAERVRVNSSGNMGVGTTSPTDTNSFSRALDVNGSSGAAVYTRTNGSATNRTVFANSGTDGYIFNGGAGTLRFYTNATQHMNISSAGNVTIDDGNLVLASGHGIDFSATSDGSGTDSSELLDDYEEGAWGPTLPNGGSASSNRSVYTKIGDMVIAYTYVTLTSIPNDSAVFAIGGLPYASTSSSNYYGAGMLGFSSDLNTSNFQQPLVENGGSYVYFHRTDGTSATIKNSDVDGATRYIILTAVYKTA